MKVLFFFLCWKKSCTKEGRKRMLLSCTTHRSGRHFVPLTRLATIRDLSRAWRKRKSIKKKQLQFMHFCNLHTLSPIKIDALVQGETFFSLLIANDLNRITRREEVNARIKWTAQITTDLLAKSSAKSNFNSSRFQFRDDIAIVKTLGSAYIGKALQLTCAFPLYVLVRK